MPLHNTFESTYTQSKCCRNKYVGPTCALGYLYFVLHIVQLKRLAPWPINFILIDIAYNCEIIQPKHYEQTFSLLKV